MNRSGQVAGARFPLFSTLGIDSQPMNPIQGVFVALVTPFRDGAIDREALQGLIEWHIACGIDGFVPCGTTGESATLSHAEHRQVIEWTIEIVAGRAPLLVEIKDQVSTIGIGKVEARVAELLANYDGPVAVMSFNPLSMIWFFDHAPALVRGLVSCASDDEDFAHLAPEIRIALAELTFFEAAHADFVTYDHHAFPSAACQRLRGKGVPVLCWTVRSKEEEAEARLHADNITFERYRAEFT